MAPPTVQKFPYMEYRAALPEGFRAMFKADLPAHKEIRLMWGIVATGLGLAIATMFWTLRKPEVQYRRGGDESRHHHPLEFDRIEQIYGKQYVLKYGKGDSKDYAKIDPHLQEVQKAMSDAKRKN